MVPRSTVLAATFDSLGRVDFVERVRARCRMLGFRQLVRRVKVKPTIPSTLVRVYTCKRWWSDSADRECMHGSSFGAGSPPESAASLAAGLCGDPTRSSHPRGYVGPVKQRSGRGVPARTWFFKSAFQDDFTQVARRGAAVFTERYAAAASARLRQECRV